LALRIAAALLLAPAAPSRAAGAPTRVVSLNMCTDELVLRLADRTHVASITWLSRDRKAANVADLAAGVPVNHGLAEEIIPLNPDLVVAGIYTTRTAVAMLKQMRFAVIEFGVPRNLADVRVQIRDMARLLNETARGERIVADMDRRLEAVEAKPPKRRPTALVFNPNGFTVGAGTLVDDIITHAGLDNIGARMKLGNYSQVPLEVVVRSEVDVLIVSASRDGPPSLATEVLNHPVLAKLEPRTRIIVLPSRLWSCGGPEVVEAIARLRKVTDDIVLSAVDQ
jgi:iron complex transport system substrate-binding protein